MNPVIIATIASFAAALLWFVLVYRLDTHEKEPISLLLKVFVVGFFLSFVAGALNTVSFQFGGETLTLILVGFVEEGVKFFAVWWIAFRNRAFNDAVDGIIYATAAALGFAFAENIGYNFLFITQLQDEAAPALIVRGFLPLLHVLLSSIWGYGLGQYKMHTFTKSKLIGLWFLAAVLHSAYDLATNAFAGVMLLAFVVLGVVFMLKTAHLNRLAKSNDRYLIGCPSCHEKIPENSLYCRYCGKHIVLIFSAYRVYCKSCRLRVSRRWKHCLHCGAQIK